MKLDFKLTKEKIFKYIRIFIFFCITTALIGIYFVQQKQFENTQLLDILLPAHLNFPRELNWAAMTLFFVAWILWEFTISKTGNQNMGFASVSIFTVSAFLTFNLLTFVGLFIAFIAMFVLIFLYVPKKSEKAFIHLLQDNKEHNQQFLKRFKNLFKTKSTKSKLGD